MQPFGVNTAHFCSFEAEIYILLVVVTIRSRSLWSLNHRIYIDKPRRFLLVVYSYNWETEPSDDWLGMAVGGLL